MRNKTNGICALAVRNPVLAYAEYQILTMVKFKWPHGLGAEEYAHKRSMYSARSENAYAEEERKYVQRCKDIYPSSQHQLCGLLLFMPCLLNQRQHAW